MIIINTPLLDFRKISTASQFDRLQRALKAEEGDLTHALVNFDYSYAKRVLARPAYLKLQQLREEVKEAHPKIAKKIERLYQSNEHVDTTIKLTRQDIENNLIIWPASTQIPADVFDRLWEREYSGFPKKGYIDEAGKLVNREIAIIVIDMDSNGVDDYVYINNSLHTRYSSSLLLYYDNHALLDQQLRISRDHYTLDHLLETNGVSLEPLRWQSIKIGDGEINISP